ncbi:hypothetical protein H6F78_17080 [Coleofasciculus sp. FACHB-64]|uniref:hypothetical protein n=1 Tax=Cyanophyceae TaxID=3028117 RepID=UPI001682933A|nr:hypothetical protein [Coleofasciculus sp. FACHB-64]MBD2047285.1 hypothetical protein [Coleofasciculus sp. FACHB-64]
MRRKHSSDFSPKDVAPHAAKWSRDELEQMKAIIEGLLQATESTSELVEEVALTNPNRGHKSGSGTGYFEEKMINGCGPYRYLRYWREGQRKSVYVGKVENQCN